MSHCFSVGVTIDGENRDICSLVPGNEDLARRVRDMESGKGEKPKPSDEEVRRAIEYHLNQHRPKDHPKPGGTMVDQIKGLHE